MVNGWPKDISTLPGNEKWTPGAGEGVFAETPDRVFMLFRGELPKMEPPRATLLPELGPSISFPWPACGETPLPRRFRASGARTRHQKVDDRGEGKDDEIGIKGRPTGSWESTRSGRTASSSSTPMATSSRPGHSGTSCFAGRIPSTSARTHRSTCGSSTTTCRPSTSSPTMASSSCRRSERRRSRVPTRPISTVRRSSTGFRTGRSSCLTATRGTRVAKFDKDGKFIMDWGIKGNPPNETRPGYMNNVHGVAVDPVSRKVFVNDRNNHRIQVFDEDGKYLSLMEDRRRSFELALALHRPGPERGPSIAAHTRWSSTTRKATCCTRGARSGCFRARSGASTAYTSIRKATVRRRSGQRTRPEIQAARRRQSGLPRRQAGGSGLGH